MPDTPLPHGLPVPARYQAFAVIVLGILLSVNAALLRLTMPAERLGRAIAFNSVVVASGSVAGPTVAAAILSFASWPWLFAINLPLGVLVFVLGTRSLPSNTHAAPGGQP